MPRHRRRRAIAVAFVLGASSALVLSASPAAAAPAAVAVWNDPAFVDTGAEGANLVAVLTAAGADVTEFTGTSLAAWTAGIAGPDIVVIPETEVANPVGAVDAAVGPMLLAYVQGGGQMMAFEPSFGNTLAFVNSSFGLTLASAGDSACPCSLAAGAAGTSYESGPATVPIFSATGSLSVASLPVGAIPIYVDDDNADQAAVVLIPQGSGFLHVLGPDAFTDLVGTPWQDVLATQVQAPASLAIDSVTVVEGISATLTVTLSEALGFDVDVLFATGDGTATGPDDFTPLASTVTIPAGETSAAITIDTVADAAAEGDETFVVTIESGTQGVVVDVATGTVTIQDPAASTTTSTTSTTTTTPPAPPQPVVVQPTFTG